MKAKTIKNKILLSVVLFGLACISLLAGWALRTEKASAAETQTGITFVEGASVRIDTDGETSGIRFSARFGKDVYDKIYDENGNNKTGAELGMIIAPHSYVEGITPTDWFTYFKEEYNMDKDKISMQFSSKKVIDKGEGVYQVNGAMVKVKYNNWGRDFRAILYYTTDNGGTYTYQVNEDARNVTGISIAAIQKESERADGDYKDSELSVLYNYADGNIPRVMYDASKTLHQGKLTQAKIGTDEKDTAFTVEKVEMNGEEWFKYTVTELGTTNAIGFTYSVEGIDLKQYDYVYFKVMSSRTGTACDLCSPDLTYVAGSWNKLTANQPFEVAMYLDQFTCGAEKGMYLVVKDLEVGDELYISSFIAHGAKSVSYMIDGLPQEGFISIPERGEVCATDKYHETLSSTAKGQVRNQAELEISKALPLVVYEAGVDNDKFNQVAMDDNGAPIFMDGGAPESEGNAFKFAKSPILLDEMTYAWAYTYTLTGNEKDLDAYDFVTFNAWTNGVKGYFAVVNAQGELALDANELTGQPTDIFLKTEHFLMGANGQLIIVFLSESADAVFYMSDVRALGVASLEGMIGRLAEEKDNDMTAPDLVSLTEINKYVGMLGEVEPDKKISSGSQQDLLRTEGRPYNVVNTTTEGATGRFIPVALENDGNGWKAEITQVREAGLNWFKITVTQKGKNGVLAYKFNTQAEDIDVNLGGYKMIALKFRVDGLGGLLSNEKGSGITIAPEGEDTDQNELTKNLTWSKDGMMYVTPLIGYTNIALSPEELFATFDSGYLILDGLNVGDSIYISDFICYNLYTAMTMIEKLPYASSIQESDYNEVKKVRAYLDQLSQSAGKTFAEVAAMEAYTTESVNIEEAFYTGYIDSLSSKFQEIEDYFTKQNIVPILPAGDPTTGEAFVSVPVQADGVVGWSGTTESVTMDGEDWVEMSIEEIGTNQTLYFKLNPMEYITDLDTIDYVTFTIKCTNPNAVLSMSVGETDGTLSNGMGLNWGDGESFVIGEDGYTFKVGYGELALLTVIMDYVDVSYTYKVTGVQKGDKVYVSSVKAYQKTYTQAIVDELPLASTISGVEILEYKEQIDLARAEVNGSSNKSNMDTTNLKALEFKLFEYYLSLLPDIKTDEDGKINTDSYKVEYIEILKNIRKYYLGFYDGKNTIYDNLEARNYTKAQATTAGNKWLDGEMVIFQVLLQKIDSADGTADEEYVVTADNVYLVEGAMSCYEELKKHKVKGTTWVSSGSILNGTWTLTSNPPEYADGKLTPNQKTLITNLYTQALRAYVNALPAAADITLDDEANVLATREWLLARKDLASTHSCNYSTANSLLGERENALLQLYIDNMADPSTVTRYSEVDIAKVRAYYTLLNDTYQVSVNVDKTKLLASEIALLREKLLIMPTVDTITINDLKAAERIYLSAVRLMDEEGGSLEVIDLTTTAAQLFIKTVQMELDALPLPEQLDRTSLIKNQGFQVLIEEICYLVPNPEWVLDFTHAIPSILAATYLDTLNNLKAEPDMDSFGDVSDTKEALQAFLDMIDYDANLMTKVETDILYKNVMALLKNYWRNLPTFDPESEDATTQNLIGTSYQTTMTDARWLYDLMKTNGISPDGLVDVSVLLKYEKHLLKNYIATLPEAADDVKMVNADSIQNVRVLFDRLQAAGVDVSTIWTDEQMQAYESALELAQLFDLPDASSVTIEHQVQIENARALFEQLKAEGTDVSAYEEALKACEVALLSAKINSTDTMACTKAKIQALRNEYQTKLSAGYELSSITADLENLEFEWIMISVMQSIFYEAVEKDSMQLIDDAYAYLQDMRSFGVKIPTEFIQEIGMNAVITLRLQIENMPEYQEITLTNAEKLIDAMSLCDMLTQVGIPVDEIFDETYIMKLMSGYMTYQYLYLLEELPNMATEEEKYDALAFMSEIWYMFESEPSVTAAHLDTTVLVENAVDTMEYLLAELPEPNTVTVENGDWIYQVEAYYTYLKAVDPNGVGTMNVQKLTDCLAALDALETEAA